MLHIDNDVCTKCNQETCSKLFRDLRVKHNIFETHIPGNHPIWEDYQKQKELLRVTCLIFEYDNCYICLCKKHLMEYVEQL